MTISRPSKGDRFWGNVTASTFHGNLEFIDNTLHFEIPDLDARRGGSTKPVSVWRKGQSVDDVTSFKGIKMLVFIQIPKHDNTIFATRSAKRTIRRDSDGRNISVVARVVGLQFALGNIPNLIVNNLAKRLEQRLDSPRKIFLKESILKKRLPCSLYMNFLLFM